MIKNINMVTAEFLPPSEWDGRKARASQGTLGFRETPSEKKKTLAVSQR